MWNIVYLCILIRNKQLMYHAFNIILYIQWKDDFSSVNYKQKVRSINISILEYKDEFSTTNYPIKNFLNFFPSKKRHFTNIDLKIYIYKNPFKKHFQFVLCFFNFFKSISFFFFPGDFASDTFPLCKYRSFSKN